MELSYILGNGNTEKIPHISGNGSFLYFGKRKPRKKLFTFRKRNILIFQEELPKPQKPKLLIFL